MIQNVGVGFSEGDACGGTPLQPNAPTIPGRSCALGRAALPAVVLIGWDGAETRTTRSCSMRDHGGSSAQPLLGRGGDGRPAQSTTAPSEGHAGCTPPPTADSRDHRHARHPRRSPAASACVLRSLQAAGATSAARHGGVARPSEYSASVASRMASVILSTPRSASTDASATVDRVLRPR